MNAIHSFTEGFWDGIKIGAKCVATVALMGVVLVTLASILTAFMAGPTMVNGLDLIWNRETS